MNILLTNDDGIYARGLAALEQALRRLGDVLVVAPSTEQSGVSQSITFLRPLVGHQVFDGERLRGYAVDGTPADCVKLGVTKFATEPPDLVVSGINGGLNAGINILYSGTVGGAMEGALFGINSFAVSLEFHTHPDYEQAAEIAVDIIAQVLQRKDDKPRLYNLNLPLSALESPAEVCVVPMETAHYGNHFIERIDPKNRTYYWATHDPAPEPSEIETDVMALKRGAITLTPLSFNLTQHDTLETMMPWSLKTNELP